MSTEAPCENTLEASAVDHTPELNRLAALSPIDYDLARETAAKRLGIRLSTIDNEIERRRSKSDPLQGQRTASPRCILEEVVPWSQPVSGSELLDGIAKTVARYMVMPKGGATAVALWSVFAHAHDAAEHSPILAVESPEKRCGKTTLLSIVAGIVPRHLPAANISPAALFRSVEEFNPTLLIDEGDSFLRDNEDMRGILNSGFTEASAFVIRCDGDQNKPRPFRTWCAKLIALIGQLPGTCQDRAIVLVLRRKLDNETVERFSRRQAAALGELREKAARWAADHLDRLRDSDPLMPARLNDRAKDCWRPLLAIADAAGGSWPCKAREAAIALSGATEDDEAASAGSLLLGHVREVFAAKGGIEIPSSALAEALNANEAWPWGEWRQGKPISPRGVARILSKFDIRPTKQAFANCYRK